jgi:hypothetical protein
MELSDEYKIYVDASQPATLNDGAGALTDCSTLQEAVLAWHKLPPGQKIRATVKVSGNWRLVSTLSFGRKLPGQGQRSRFRRKCLSRRRP